MIKTLRRGTDLAIEILFTRGGRELGDLKNLSVFVKQTNSKCCKHMHQPTATSTNICCCNNKPLQSEIELKSLVTETASGVAIVEALFPADMQYVSGVYCLIIRWSEKTDDLIAENEEYNFVINEDDVFELTDDSKEIDSPSNKIQLTIEYGEDPK